MHSRICRSSLNVVTNAETPRPTFLAAFGGFPVRLCSESRFQWVLASGGDLELVLPVRMGLRSHVRFAIFRQLRLAVPQHCAEVPWLVIRRDVAIKTGPLAAGDRTKS